ncbi:alpha/beta hydrolase [Streptomyces sp. NPDC042319]|uniref:alpha/beta hydrolase n=1 Tax=Streptomyces sp. NPDC042319 TaxID=3154332 RepID=UPI0033F0CF17
MPLDPEVRRVVGTLPTVDWESGPDPAALRAARRRLPGPVPPGLEMHTVEDRTVRAESGACDGDGHGHAVSSGGDDHAVRARESSACDGHGHGHAVRVRCYRPSARSDLPLVLFFHGGGFVLGDLDTQDALARRIARDAEAVVVSVDYRLAPEHPCPAAPDDAFTAYRWALRHAAAELGADPGRIAVCGESAGGNLAAGLCLRARDAGLPLPVLQLLWYPSTDFRDTPSRHENAHAPLLNRAALRWLDAQYLPPALRAEPPAWAAPARAASLHGLPAAYVLVAQYDPLRDEGADYARRLRDAGVPVRFDLCPTMPHGFLSLIGSVPSCAAAAADSFAALRQALWPHTPTAGGLPPAPPTARRSQS